MTGPEHYREAERLIAGHGFKIEGEQFHNAPTDREIAQAQVHATLALTAATAMQAAVDGSEPGMSGEEHYAWYVAAGVKPIRPVAPDAAANEAGEPR